MSQPPPLPEPVKEVDFFQDMTPKVITQQRVLINTGNENSRSSFNFSRLQADSDIPVMNELKDWEELEQQGWEEVDDESTKRLIREKKKELRHQRHQTQNSPQQYPMYGYRT